MLEVRSLSAVANGVDVVQDVDLTIGAGEVHVLFGPNGSGKSSLLKTIMGLSPFEATGGEIRLFGDDVADESPDRRAARGVGMAFQSPPNLQGVSVSSLATVLGAGDRLQNALTTLDLPGFADRQVSVGFSGGEVKRWEVAKLHLQAPRLLLLDEPDSGVDLEHVAAVAVAIDRLVRSPSEDGEPRSALIVSHTGSVIDGLEVDVGHLMVDGRLIHTGEPIALFDHIRTNGYVAPAPATTTK
ncbi:MAG: ATP-binding cassette domain-containing protein [Actinomycetota bacterium]